MLLTLLGFPGAFRLNATVPRQVIEKAGVNEEHAVVVEDAPGHRADHGAGRGDIEHHHRPDALRRG